MKLTLGCGVLLLVGGLAGTNYADQASDSFGTGFASSLQRMIEAKAYRDAQIAQNQESAARIEELAILREQVDLQKEQLRLEQQKHRERWINPPQK